MNGSILPNQKSSQFAILLRVLINKYVIITNSSILLIFLIIMTTNFGTDTILFNLQYLAIHYYNIRLTTYLKIRVL